MDNEHLEKGEWMSRDITLVEKKDKPPNNARQSYTRTHIYVYTYSYILYS